MSPIQEPPYSGLIKPGSTFDSKRLRGLPKKTIVFIKICYGPNPKVHWWWKSCTSLYSTLSDYSLHYVRVYLAALVHGHGLRPTRTQFLRRKFTVITASWRHLSGVHYKYLFATLKKYLPQPDHTGTFMELLTSLPLTSPTSPNTPNRIV